MNNITSERIGYLPIVTGKSVRFVVIALMVFLISSGIFLNEPAQAAQSWCAIQYLDTKSSTMNSIAVSLGEVTYSDELCQDAAISLSLFNDDSKKFIQATGSSIATGTDPTNYYKTNTWSRALNDQEKKTYWCLISSGNSTDWVGNGGWLIGWLPSSPESARIPTQIQKMFGDGTLAASLMLELYGASWQLLLIFALIKFYRLIPFKAT